MLDVSRLVEEASPLSVATYDGEGADWDAYVARADGGNFCHLSGWRAVMEDVLGHRVLYRVVVDTDGEWHGLLPLVNVRSRLFGNYLLSMPFLNYGGVVGSPVAAALLLGRAMAEARQLDVDLLELRSRGVPEAPGTRVRKITVTLPLPGEAEALFSAFPSKLRSQIRRPMKAGHEVRFGLAERDAFYEVFARNMRDLGTPVLPATFFERIAERFADRVVFGVVYRGGQPVAGGCGFIWRDEFEMTWASSLRQYSREAPNMLLYWGFMERMIEAGIRRFNFGRCTPGGGTHRFKMQWGGEEEPLPWLSWSSNGRTATPSPDAPLFRLATRVWSRLPLAVANTVGPMIARRIP